MSPKRLGRPCLQQGCPALVTVTRYCPKHAPLHPAWAGVARRTERGTYGIRHVLWRKRVLAEHPVCVCGAASTEAHHVVAMADGGARYDDNGRGLCKRCHAAETSREIAARRKGAA